MEDLVIQGLRQGDRDVVKKLYKDCFAYCASFVINNRGEQEQARDLFQEALIVLFKNSRKADFKLTCNVKTYLYSVVRNQWLKKITRADKGGLKLVIDQDPEREYILVDEDVTEEAEEKEEKHEAVSQAMKLIKEDCQNLIMNFYFKKVDLSNIAEQMGYTYQFVKVKKNRCMAALKKKVKELYKDD